MDTFVIGWILSFLIFCDPGKDCDINSLISLFGCGVDHSIRGNRLRYFWLALYCVYSREYLIPIYVLSRYLMPFLDSPRIEEKEIWRIGAWLAHPAFRGIRGGARRRRTRG